MSDKCPKCQGKVFQIFFNDDGRYQGVVWKRCMNINCNQVYPCNQEEAEMALDMHKEKEAK